MRRVAMPFLALVIAVLSACGTRATSDIVADLESPDAEVVVEALLDFERQHPGDATLLGHAKRLVTDHRPTVRRKAARVLGAINAAVEPQTVDQIARMLSAGDRDEVVDALKALRQLPAQRAVPGILPLLRRSDPHIVRDACRTLAVLADRTAIPAIEPLLRHPDEAVRRDAEAAIARLRAK